ncbi:DUF899 domain-containing protein [Pseudonocardia halophobica]|uniref:Dithiol-disulfide oxidoreductase (DUF899 family) n=1 Tax=Pseudonocardia halophobica TaxID=29401 RepID=A0A9W6UGE0_9PSEU|nr:DUF899 domain-containing protein [Pseudonocardia halophobica]GLL16103.1 hypothetical protein GCM10017577_72580 [Pseudonocardia halophobica]
MALPQVVSRDEWLAARRALLLREKELTRARDVLAADRRRLPMVRVEQDYRFTGPEGEVGLLDLFAGRSQLILQHFMYDPARDEPCRSCSAMAAETGEGVRDHLARRDTAFAAVSRAPYPKLQAVREARGWTFPWYSSEGSTFNYDFHATLDPAVAPANYNFRDAGELSAAGLDWMVDYVGEQPAISTFLRDGDQVFHTWSAYGRGVEEMMHGYHLLDLTALGRQEDWEEPKGRAPVVHAADPGYTS